MCIPALFVHFNWLLSKQAYTVANVKNVFSCFSPGGFRWSEFLGGEEKIPVPAFVFSSVSSEEEGT